MSPSTGAMSHAPSDFSDADRDDSLASSGGPVAAGSMTPLHPVARSSRYVLGICLLLAVVFLWVGSSTLIQEIFVDLDFREPFFLTYYSTSLFSLYLPAFAMQQWVRRQTWWRRWRRSERARMRDERVLLATDADEYAAGGSVQSAAPRHAPDRPATPSTPVLADARTNYSYDSHQSTPRRIEVQPSDAEVEGAEPPPQKWSLLATARLSLSLCPLWFGMNWAFNASLNLTSIASSTILSTSSSLFVLVFSYFLDTTVKVKLQHVVGVAITILGVVLISINDRETSDDESGSDGTSTPVSHQVFGDILATLGAIFYGLYTVLLKLRIPDDSVVEMQLVFGFLGLFNALLLWPGFFLLAAAGVESWSTPPANVMLFLTINGVFGTVISDYLWAKSVLLTSPLIASLGLALTIPLAIIVDWALHGLRFTAVYCIGGICVLVGFILVNVVHSHDVRVEEAAAASRARSAAASARTSARTSAANTPRHSIIDVSQPNGTPSLLINEASLHSATSTPRAHSFASPSRIDAALDLTDEGEFHSGSDAERVKLRAHDREEEATPTNAKDTPTDTYTPFARSLA